MKHTKESLISALTDFYATHKYVPTAHETISLTDLPRYTTFERKFGSWRLAVEAAGLQVAGRKVLSHEVSCVTCNTTISVNPCQIRRSKSQRFYCSKSCSASYNNRNKQYGTRISKFERYAAQRLPIDFPTLTFLFNSKQIIGSELDIYVEQLKLAIEVNGICHYKPIYGESKLLSIQRNDQMKAVKCFELAICLQTLDISLCSKPSLYPTYYAQLVSLIQDQLPL